MTANVHRGEALLELGGTSHILRPTFTALCAAEEELGPLFALVERAASGKLRLGELAALFWYCLEQKDGLGRDAFSAALARIGLAAAAKPLRVLLGQILQGAPPEAA